MEELNLDQDFLMRFSCMGTQDKDVLISQLHGILDSQLSREGCAFFLDMTNWNLQAAVGAFYDHYSNEGGMLPQMTLVGRKSVDGQNAASLTLPANTVFTETWTLKNTGAMPWPLGVHITLKTGEELSSSSQTIHLPNLPSGAETSVTLQFQAPSVSGVYHSQWRTCTGGGALFGDPVWVIVRVQDDASILGLANQLSNITTQETDMESEETCTDKTRHDQDVAPSMSTSCQEHTFGSGSMMTSPNSIPTGVCLERLLQNHPPSPTDSGREELACQGRQENTPLHLDSVRASADSSSHPSSIPMHSVSNQNQTLEWNSGLAQQQQHGALSPAPPGMISTVASMEETPNADLNPT